MKVEKIRILTEELGLQEDIDDLIKMHRYSKGDFAFTKKGKLCDAKKYQPMFELQRELIAERLGVLLPEFDNWKFSFGRLGDGSSYITIFNPDWE